MDGLAKILWGLAELLWTQLLHFVVKQEAAHRLNTVRDKSRVRTEEHSVLTLTNFTSKNSELEKRSVS